MIVAEFFEKGTHLVGFNVSGHADYAEYGEDVVCASVSSAVQLVCNTVTECFGDAAQVSVDARDGISLRLANDSSDSPCVRVIDGLRLHLEVLSEDFPNRINLRITEV
jgi:uncharacterized protein YsxB (DUF464 family)